jgi:alkanesulfonate monooxygenase SsuD/methylene tetrahydromethanopterin reductase-like flavin-dependent oxidoreductase (luciferase family)
VSRALALGAVPDRGRHPAGRRLEPSILESIGSVVLTGSPDEVHDQVTALGDAGVTQVIAGFRFGRMPARTASASMRLFAAEVLPHLTKGSR